MSAGSQSQMNAVNQGQTRACTNISGVDFTLIKDFIKNTPTIIYVSSQNQYRLRCVLNTGKIATKAFTFKQYPDTDLVRNYIQTLLTLRV